MYGFMIVDDDKLVRQRILASIPTERLELQLCAEAENGLEALELFEQYHPTIVIMDINIPLLNGLETAKRMMDMDPDINVVVITGYGTVDFAQEAIRSGMVDFLLKPVNAKELEDVLQRVITRVQQRTHQALEQQRMERLLQRSMPLLQSRYFLSLMRMPSEDMTEEECRRYLKDFGITGLIQHICVAIISPNYRGLSVNQQLPMQALLEEDLKKVVASGGEIGCLVIFDSMQRAILIAYGTEARLNFFLERKLSALRDKMRYLYQLDFHASIGCVVSGFCQLSKSYLSAEQAMDYRSIFGENNVVNSDNVRQISLVSRRPASEPMGYGELMDLLISADFEQLHQTLGRYLSQLAYDCKGSVQALQLNTVELLAMLFSSARELGVSQDAVPSARQSPYMRILLAADAREIAAIVTDAMDSIVQEIRKKQEQSKCRAIDSAKYYIHQNYADPDLSLVKVADQVNLSPAYVSQLFKRNEGCSFPDYLNRVRVEQARRLLSTTHLRVYEVAAAVGYQNSKYFFQVFKQITGKRPREFYESSSGAHNS